MTKINPGFSNDLKKFGTKNTNACFNCGNCTATCTLSTKDNSFPREMVRYSVLGLESEIQSSLKPWLCYYCGECNSTCPREANPGELMMSLRRWLTAKYDWTGLSGLLYRSLPVTILVFIIVAVGIIAFSASQHFNLASIMHYGHLFEMFSIIGVFLIVLFPNIIRMWRHTILKPKVKASLGAYFKALADLVVHMFTQKRSLGCDDDQFRWFEHFILVLGYLALLFTTVVLNWFGTNNLFIITLGYIESALVFLVTIHFVSSRVKKKKEVNRHSQPSDWFFVIWLFLLGLTAFIVRIFIDTNLLATNSWLYLFHLIILAQWALVIVPFGKWTHFLYRSFAMYFDRLKELAK